MGFGRIGVIPFIPISSSVLGDEVDPKTPEFLGDCSVLPMRRLGPPERRDGGVPGVASFEWPKVPDPDLEKIEVDGMVDLKTLLGAPPWV